MQNSQPLNTMQTIDFVKPIRPILIDPSLMNVVDNARSEIGLFRDNLYLPKNDVNAPSSGRNCLNFE